MHKIYSECVFCGKKKHPNLFGYCSNDCRRTRKELSDRFWDNKLKVEAKIAGLLNKKPMVYYDLSAKLIKEFSSFKINKWEMGKMLSALISSGKLRVYPYKISGGSGRSRSFCYIRSAQREEAFSLYIKYLRALPPELRTKIYLDSLEMRKAAPEILKLWDKGDKVEQISKETKISINRIKELIIKRRG